MTKELTRVEFLCEDQLVGKIQRMLMQIRGAYDFKATPVVNAEVKPNGGVKAITDGTLMQQFIGYLDTSQIKEFKPKDLQGWLQSIGRSRLSAGYLLKNARKTGLLIARGKTGARVYTVKS